MEEEYNLAKRGIFNGSRKNPKYTTTPPAASPKIENMTVIEDIDGLMKDDCMRLIDKQKFAGQWTKECENCGLPVILHRGVCTRGGQVTLDDQVKMWREFKEKMNPAQNKYNDKANRDMVIAEVAKELERRRGNPQEHNSLSDLVDTNK